MHDHLYMFGWRAVNQPEPSHVRRPSPSVLSTTAFDLELVLAWSDGKRRRLSWSKLYSDRHRQPARRLEQARRPHPLMNVEVTKPAESKEEEITVAFPFLNRGSSVAEGANSGAAVISADARRSQSLPIPPPASLVDALEGTSDPFPASMPKAPEAEDVLSNAPSRHRRTAILTCHSTSLTLTTTDVGPPQHEQDASASDPIPIYTLAPLPASPQVHRVPTLFQLSSHFGP